MVYYSSRKVYILKDPKLHDPSLDRGPRTRFLSREEFLKLWGSKERVACVYDRSQQGELFKLPRSERVSIIGGFGTRVVRTNRLAGSTLVTGRFQMNGNCGYQSGKIRKASRMRRRMVNAPFSTAFTG